MTNKDEKERVFFITKNLIASKCYSFRCASVDPWDGSNVVLRKVTKRALDQSPCYNVLTKSSAVDSGGWLRLRW